MAKTPITTAQLSTYLQAAINQYPQSQPLLFEILTLLYSTGLRIGEVLDSARWSQKGNGDWDVQLQKGDATRTIDQALVTGQLEPIYLNGLDFGYYTYTSVNFSIRQSVPVITVNVDVRPVTSHLFRYYFIKDLHDQGMTDQQIKNTIKHASLSSTQAYIYDQLYINTPDN